MFENYIEHSCTHITQLKKQFNVDTVWSVRATLSCLDFFIYNIFEMNLYYSVSVVGSFLLYEYATCCSSIYEMTAVVILPNCWLWRIILLWNLCTCLFVDIPSLPRVFLSKMDGSYENFYLDFWKIIKYFPV